jgi:hypothetical protein
VALLPEPTVRREVEAGTLAMVPLSTDELVRPLGIIHRRGKELGSTTRRFIELLQAESQFVSRVSQAATTVHAHSPECCGGAHESNGRQESGCGNGAPTGMVNGASGTNGVNGGKGAGEHDAIAVGGFAADPGEQPQRNRKELAAAVGRTAEQSGKVAVK